jgi:hypothetical protein
MNEYNENKTHYLQLSRFIDHARRIITSFVSYVETAKSARDKFKNLTPIN